MSEKIEIRGGIIRLGQFLKIAMLVESGGEAKARIQAGEVLVNGEVETRRGRQLSHLDIVRLDERSAQVFVIDYGGGTAAADACPPRR
ncbi:MAG: RNA-binding S4 domain-containing protein [Desulfurivibrionaceae bacterium]|nr:RNA-binding S4 domain-containing protein [Desulfobulbales bacterium]MDT8334277.1 RNA-binding S4 domain-containing protein [Desulfurivibrionaceae bacterium]